MKCVPPCFSLVLLCSAVVCHGELIPRKPGGPAVPAAPVVPVAPLTAEEMKKLKEQVDLLEKEIARKRGGMHTSQLALIKEAMSSNEKAFNFWLDCKKEQDFEMKGKTATEFSEWKRDQIKKTGTDDNFCVGLRLQLHFLMLTVLDSHAETAEQEADVAAGALGYVDSLVAFCDKQETLAKGVLGSMMEGGGSAIGGDVLSSIFAKHLKLDGSVNPKKGGATSAGNIDEIYDRMIIEPLRKKKDAAGIASAWTKRIDHTARVAKATKVPEIMDQYTEMKVPDMKFSMYRDQWSAGQQKQAATAMIALISGHPTHKDSNGWMNELKSLASGEDLP